MQMPFCIYTHGCQCIHLPSYRGGTGREKEGGGGGENLEREQPTGQSKELGRLDWSKACNVLQRGHTETGGEGTEC